MVLKPFRSIALWWVIRQLKGLPVGPSPKRPNRAAEVNEQVIRRIVSHGRAALPCLHAIIAGDEYPYVKKIAVIAVGRIGDPQSIPVLTNFLTNDTCIHSVHRAARQVLENIGNLNDPVTLQGLCAFERTLERTHDAWLVYVDKTTFRRRMLNDDRRYMECYCEGVGFSSLSPEIIGGFVPIKVWLIPLGSGSEEDAQAVAVSVDFNPIRDFDLSRFENDFPVSIFDVPDYMLDFGASLWRSPTQEDKAHNVLQFFLDPLPVSKVKTPFIVSGRLLTHLSRYMVRVQMLLHAWDETADFAVWKRYHPDAWFNPEPPNAIGENSTLPVQVETIAEIASGILKLGAAQDGSVFDGELLLCGVSDKTIIVEGTTLTRLRHEDKDEPNPLPFNLVNDIRNTVAVVLSAVKL